MIRQSQVNTNLFIRDGQTLPGGTATDPIRGRVLKMDLSVDVVKEAPGRDFSPL
ncbi:MAG: hypothetical protein HY237_15280 [Acidobacteria bacterium]|nr:hypothetical protein [Acidobacteriota bacterium]